MAKVSVDQVTCIGCSLCNDICPETFEMNGMKAFPKRPVVDTIGKEKEAEDMCPVDAIKVEE
jgi:ferredoxin